MRTESKIAALAADIAIAITILYLLANAVLIFVMKQTGNNGTMEEWVADLSGAFVSVSGILSIIATLGFTIVFIVWLRMSYGNLSKKAGDLRFAVGWSVGAWFVPILNLFRPYQIVKDLFARSYHHMNIENIPGTRRVPSGDIDWWWACCILSAVIWQFSFRAERMINTETWNSFVIFNVIDMIACFIEIFYYFFAKKLVTEYSKVEAHFI